MQAVALHLPEIHRQRLVEHRVPTTIESLFSEVADLLEHLRATPAEPEQLQDNSHQLKFRLLEFVESVGPELDPQNAREATLAAMTSGMFSGALDGTLLYAHRLVSVQPAVLSLKEGLEKPSRLLWENLSRVIDVGQSSWGEAHIDDLQLLAGFGKHENLNSLEEGEAVEAQSRADRLEFQTFLLASFKGGYAMGVVDAAVVHVGGERPGAAPQDY